MARPRKLALTTLLFLSTGAGLVLSSHCGTSARGTGVCRSIEQARCSAGVDCGVVADEAACLRAVETRCLHGLAVEELPGQVSVGQCVTAIEAAGRCARRLGEEAPPCECRELPAPEPSADTVCELVLEPERLAQCRFLLGQDAPPVSDSSCPAPDAGAPPPDDAGG